MKKNKTDINKKKTIYISLYVFTILVIILSKFLYDYIDMDGMKIIIGVDLLFMGVCLVLNSKVSSKEFLKLSPVIVVILLLGMLLFDRYEDIRLSYTVAFGLHVICTIIIGIVSIIEHFVNKK